MASRKKKTVVRKTVDERPAGAAAAVDDEDMYQEPYRMIKVPADQLDLNEAELKEEFQRLLTANDPNVPNNVTKFSYHKKEFKIDPPGTRDQMAIHFKLKGCSYHKDSSEAKEQNSYYQKYKDELTEARKAIREEHGKDDDENDVFENRKNQFTTRRRLASVVYPIIILLLAC